MRHHRLVAAGALALAMIACSLPGQAGSAPTQPAPAAPTAPSTAAPNFNVDSVKQGFAQGAPALMKANGSTGCSAGAVYPGADGSLQTSFFATGTRSATDPTPVGPDTVYEIGSLSKLFTADILATNIESGSMRLDDPLQNYLPGILVPAFNGQAITRRDLATHPSGLPRTPGTPAVTRVNGVELMGAESNQELFNFLSGYHLTRAPGSKWEYSNLAFSLLTIADEKAGGADYPSLVAKDITGPLAMPDTAAALTADQLSREAAPYNETGGKAVTFAQSGPLAPVFRLTQEVATTVGPAPGAAMGLGWQIYHAGGPGEEYAKDGATAGYTAYIAFFKASRAGYVLGCNGRVAGKLAPLLNKLIGQADTPADDNE